MTNLIIALPLSIIISLLALLTAVSVYTLAEKIGDGIERRKRIKQLDSLIESWTRLADEECDPLEKGYKTARLLNLEYERRKLSDTKRKRKHSDPTVESV